MGLWARGHSYSCERFYLVSSQRPAISHEKLPQGVGSHPSRCPCRVRHCSQCRAGSAGADGGAEASSCLAELEIGPRGLPPPTLALHQPSGVCCEGRWCLRAHRYPERLEVIQGGMEFLSGLVCYLVTLLQAGSLTATTVK